MAGKGVREIIRSALTMRRRERTRGPWRVTVEGHNLGGSYESITATMALHHYGTKMLEWTYRPSTGAIEITGTWTGWGSVSDQTGVNAALSALGSNMRYSRDIRGGGPRVNPFVVGRAAGSLRATTPPVY